MFLFNSPELENIRGRNRRLSQRARQPPFQILIGPLQNRLFPLATALSSAPLSVRLSIRRPFAEPGRSRRGCEPLRAACGNHNMHAAAEPAIKYLAALFPKKGHEESCGMYVMTVEAFLRFSLPYPSLAPALSAPLLPSSLCPQRVSHRRSSCVRVYIKVQISNIYILLTCIFTHAFYSCIQFK